MVTPDARRAAKAVNFGIVYGISGFGLAQQLGIPRAEAEKYIKNYFARYTGVKRFIEETIAEVRQTGVTRTLFGRERPIPDINSRNPNSRGFAERTAVNSPVCKARCCSRYTTNWFSNVRRKKWNRSRRL
jgi:DNA polymerase-1